MTSSITGTLKILSRTIAQDMARDIGLLPDTNLSQLGYQGASVRVIFVTFGACAN